MATNTELSVQTLATGEAASLSETWRNKTRKCKVFLPLVPIKNNPCNRNTVFIILVLAEKKRAKTDMNPDELIEIWKHEEQQQFSGWDFSYLNSRMIEDEHPWSYSSRAAELMRHSSSVIDMGTGGGERFLQLKEYWSTKVVVTEEYSPNFKLATERLSPFDVLVFDVRLTEDDPMPFKNDEFDLVLNRHSAFNSSEVARILAPGGTFLTQQIHGLWAYD
jgi:SAM-dependent methyltransferase